MRNILNKIFQNSSDADIHSLLKQAEKFPRYTPHKFQFRDMNLSVTDFLSVAWQIKEIIGDEEMKFKSAKLNPVIIDCGSNIGISIIYFRKIFPEAKIVAFEPSPSVFKCLNENLKSNNIAKVDVFEKAVWVDNNGVNFGEDGADGGSIFSEKVTSTIPTIRLKEVLENESEIDMLKIDIEGAEVPVLLDCQNELRKVKNIYVEYHSFKNQTQQLDKLLGLLTNNGFRYYIRSIGNNIINPFIFNQPDNPMDIQLNIHAIQR